MITMTDEFTKIVNKECCDCKEKLQILCSEISKIISIRCHNCLKKFELKNKKYVVIHDRR